MSKSSRIGTFTIGELREFASFPACTQRYIKCSIDVALSRSDAEAVWGRDASEKTTIRAQCRIYEALPEIKSSIPSNASLTDLELFIGKLVQVSAFDLGQCKLPHFSSYRFLYERILGATVRPWLPSAFCAAASLPFLHRNLRKTLLQSISEAAATAPGWSDREPTFIPEWVEKEYK